MLKVFYSMTYFDRNTIIISSFILFKRVRFQGFVEQQYKPSYLVYGKN